MVEHYAYQNELSLQRYIRTDIAVRRSSIIKVENQYEHIKQKSNRNLGVQATVYERPMLKRMHSVDTLHTQRHPQISPHQSTIFIPNLQLK